MTDPAAMAQLLAQAEAHGGDLVTLRALVEEASGLGADRALARLGLEDAQARRDMDELRALLRAWRDAKTAAGHALIEWVIRIALAATLLALAVRFGLSDLVRG